MNSTTAWTEEEWAIQFGKVFEEEVETEWVRNENRPASFRTSGRKSKKWPNKEDESFWLSEGPRFAKSYADWRMNNGQYSLWVTPDGEPASELDMVVEFGTTKVRAIIDRVFTMRVPDGNGKIEEHLFVLDLKSGAMAPEDTLQLAFYAACIDLKYGTRPSIGAYFDARSGTTIGMEPLDVYPTDLVVGMVEDFVKQRDLGVFLPNPGRQCLWCDVRTSCPYSKGVR